MALAAVSIFFFFKQKTAYEMALAIFRQQAMAIGRLFTIAANFLDPDEYFLGGGVVEAAPHFRDWFFAEVRAHTVLREEQARAAKISLVPDLDMAEIGRASCRERV